MAARIWQSKVLEDRNRFFPGWWTHRERTQDALKPLYVVVCKSPQDLLAAKAAQPMGVRARFLLDNEYTFDDLLKTFDADPETLAAWISATHGRVPSADKTGVYRASDVAEIWRSRIVSDATDLFSEPNTWLNAPNRRLGGASPNEIIARGGASLVAEILESIKLGLYS